MDPFTIHKKWPKVSLSDPQLTYPRMNPIAKRYQKAFEEAFTDFILPTGSNQFIPNAAPMYVYRRNWKMEEDFAPHLSAGQRHEEKLHSVFWDPKHHVIQFIEGEAGCGKTTLCDYYLRCYCPGDKARQVDFGRKLPIHVNLRAIFTREDFNRRLYPSIQHAMQKAFTAAGLDCNELESEDDYAMWEPEMKWNSKKHDDARGQLTIREYRSKAISERTNTSHDSGQEWVELALKRISYKIDKKLPLPFTYIVLCLDNMDQSTHEVQEYGISIVRRWIENKIKFWQIYIPLWPNTLASLLPNLRPIRYGRIRVGALQPDEVIEKRNANIQNIIRGECTYVELGEAERVTPNGATITNEDIAMFFEHAYTKASHEFKTFLAYMSGEST